MGGVVGGGKNIHEKTKSSNFNSGCEVLCQSFNTCTGG